MYSAFENFQKSKMENLNIVFQHVLKPKWLLVFAITANNLLVVCDKSSCAKTSRYPASAELLWEKRNFKIDRIKSYAIKIGYMLLFLL
jgi:hypothetical protein